MKKTVMMVTFAACVAFVQAETLLSWNFNDNPTASASAQASDYNHEALQSSSLVDGGGFAYVVQNTTQGTNDWAFFRSVDNATVGTALAGGDYWSFTVTSAGPSLSVTSIVFGAHAREGAQTFTFALYSSADNYASPLGSSVSFTSTTGYEPYDLTISGFNVPVSSSVTFRLAVCRIGTADLYKPITLANLGQAPAANGFEVRGLSGPVLVKATTFVIE